MFFSFKDDLDIKKSLLFNCSLIKGRDLEHNELRKITKMMYTKKPVLQTNEEWTRLYM